MDPGLACPGRRIGRQGTTTKVDSLTRYASHLTLPSVSLAPGCCSPAASHRLALASRCCFDLDSVSRQLMPLSPASVPESE